ncbi:hypothetical protein JYU12_01770 [bacterium AH-315-K03]|nr:hypothetical protein [bacterium AH-315-K03]
MAKRSDSTLKVAWIAATGVAVAALITASATIFSSSNTSKQNQEKHTSIKQNSYGNFSPPISNIVGDVVVSDQSHQKTPNTKNH